MTADDILILCAVIVAAGGTLGAILQDIFGRGR